MANSAPLYLPSLTLTSYLWVFFFLPHYSFYPLWKKAKRLKSMCTRWGWRDRQSMCWAFLNSSCCRHPCGRTVPSGKLPDDSHSKRGIWMMNLKDDIYLMISLTLRHLTTWEISKNLRDCPAQQLTSYIRGTDPAEGLIRTKGSSCHTNTQTYRYTTHMQTYHIWCQSFMYFLWLLFLEPG